MLYATGMKKIRCLGFVMLRMEAAAQLLSQKLWDGRKSLSWGKGA